MISSLMRRVSSGDIPFGPYTPNQDSAENPGTVSPIVGMSGASGERCGPLTARPFTRPCLTSGTPEMTASSARCTFPWLMSAIDDEVPLYGTWVIVTPAWAAKSSKVKWPHEPMPLLE